MKSLIPWKNKHDNATVGFWNDDLLDRFWEGSFGNMLSPFSFYRSQRLPSVDVSEDGNEVTVRAELPGMNEKDIELTWHNGILRIRGEKKSEKEEKKKGYHYRECSYGSFSRDIPLGDTVDWSNAKAKYKNGVLTVKLPKKESSRKAIEIKVE